MPAVDGPSIWSHTSDWNGPVSTPRPFINILVFSFIKHRRIQHTGGYDTFRPTPVSEITAKDLDREQSPSFDRVLRRHAMAPSRQILVQSCAGSSFFVDASTPFSALKKTLESACGIPPDDQVLVNGSVLVQVADEDASLSTVLSLDDELNISPSGSGSIPKITASRRVCGGKLVKVKMMTDHLPCGSEVQIDIDEQSSKDEIKMKLSEKTGVPFEHVKVMLSGINQIVMGDKRTNIGYSSCGYANSVQLAVEKAE